MAITASFLPDTGVLSVFGDSQSNTINASRDAAGKILINGGAVAVVGGDPTVANTGTIQVFGQAGDDTIALDESDGALPAANLFGGDGNDTITGGSGNDLLFGQAGNDILLGKGGNDQLFGGDGNDTLTGGTGNDQMLGEAGNDRMIWNPGEGTDLMEGGDGIDTAEVNGGNGAENFTISANGTRVRFDRTNPAPFSLDIGTTENFVLNMNDGDDVFTAGNGLANLIQLTVDGGAGNDTITGGNGNDTLLGGDGNDTIIGGRGSDTARLGSGDDTFVWNPGDGSDVVDGQGGFDTLQFNGANVNEKIDISANGSRASLTRDVGNVTMDLGTMERIQIAALGGADNFVINDLSATDVQQVAIDLSGTPGSGVGDGAADSITVNGTSASNQIMVAGSGGTVSVTGLSAQVTIAGAEGANNSLFVKALGGDDTITASGNLSPLIALTIDGGAGNDTILGGNGDDQLLGGDGNDFIDGNQGSDTALLGAGDDVFQWDPGDGSDVVDGGDGFDKLQFNGANISENVDISAGKGGHATFTRNVATITMDLDNIERIQFEALGGVDNIVVNDLSRTDVQQVAIDLSATAGSGLGDGQADSVAVDGTLRSDQITVTGAAGSIAVTGLSAAVTLTGTEGANDFLVVKALGGSDTINASGLAAGQIKLTIDGGTGNDNIIGSAGDDMLIAGDGNDTVVGGKGNDTAFLGDGNDTFVWNPGDASDTVEGQGGIDTLVFNGANINEKIDISADGSRVRLTRDVGTVTMDVDGTEKIDVNAAGGADNITVNDLTGTDVKQVAIDLGGAAGGGDDQEDTVSIKAADGQKIRVTDHNGVVTVSGLGSTVTISNFEEDTDHLLINNQIVAVTDGKTITVAAVNGDNIGDPSTANDASHAAALLGQHMVELRHSGRWPRRDADCRCIGGKPAAIADPATRLRWHRAPENVSEH